MIETQIAEQNATQATEVTQSAQATQTTRKRRKTPHVWIYFESVGLREEGKERAKCIHGGSLLMVNSLTHGTNHLKQHLENNSNVPKKVDLYVCL